jgi:O-antigen/teichoic acid export membrane protein
LIPIYKSYGAAISTFSTQLFTLLGMVYLCYKDLNISINTSVFLRLLAFVSLFTVLTFLIRDSYLAPWYVLLALAGSIGIALIFALRLIGLTFIFNFVKQKKNS